MMNNSNKKLTLFTSLPSKLLPELLPKSDVPKLILTLFAMEHLQSTTLLIQSIYFSQLVNKPSLLSTPMSQSAHSHTTLALTWTSTPELKFWLEESQYTSLRYHLVEISAHKLLIFNSVSLLVKTWQLWSFVSRIKRISTIIQQNISIRNTPCVIYPLCMINLWMITQCLYTLDYPGQQFATNVGWTVTKQKHCPQIIIHQAHSGKELCRHIVKPLTLTTTQSLHQTVFIRLRWWREGRQSHSRRHDSISIW